MRACKECLYPANHPLGISFLNGKCSGCFTHAEKYSLDWEQRKLLLQEKLKIITEQSKSHYHCVVPVSGDAEDYHTISMVLKLGLNPLVVSVNDYFMNDIGWHNLHNLITFFDLDSYGFNPEISIYKELVRTSMRKYNHALWPSLALKSSFPVHVANQKKIPLIIYGQNQPLEQVGKYSHLDEVELTEWSRVEHDLFGVEIEDLLGSGGHVDPKDHQYYNYPPLRRLGKSKLIGLYLSNYFPWDSLRQNSKVMEFGYIPQIQSSTFDPYERAGNSIYYSFHDLTKFLRCGYRKISDHVAREIRHSRINTDEGKSIISSYASQPVYIKGLFDWLEVTSSGYEWFLTHKLSKAQHLITEDKDINTSFHIKLPDRLQDEISEGRLASQEYVAFMKGISL